MSWYCILHDTHGMIKENADQGIEKIKHYSAKDNFKKLKDNLWIDKNICKPYTW